jgi:hypothetical protein
VPLTPAQLAALRARTAAALGGAGHAALQAHAIGWAKLVLTFACRAASASSVTAGATGGGGGGGGEAAEEAAAAWCSLLLDLAGASPAELLPDLLWVVEAAMRHSGSLCSAMQRRLCAETAAATAAASASATSTAFALQPLPPPPGTSPPPPGTSPPPRSPPGEPLLARLAIFLLLLLRSPRPPALLPHLCAHLCTLATATGGGGAAGGGGGGGHGRWARLQGLLGGLASLPALSSRSELVLELALFCCEPVAATATATATATAIATATATATATGTAAATGASTA